MKSKVITSFGALFVASIYMATPTNLYAEPEADALLKECTVLTGIMENLKSLEKQFGQLDSKAADLIDEMRDPKKRAERGKDDAWYKIRFASISKNLERISDEKDAVTAKLKLIEAENKLNAALNKLKIVAEFSTKAKEKVGTFKDAIEKLDAAVAEPSVAAEGAAR